jgi:hypothetical protein
MPQLIERGRKWKDENGLTVGLFGQKAAQVHCVQQSRANRVTLSIGWAAATTTAAIIAAALITVLAALTAAVLTAAAHLPAIPLTQGGYTRVARTEVSRPIDR